MVLVWSFGEGGIGRREEGGGGCRYLKKRRLGERSGDLIETVSSGMGLVMSLCLGLCWGGTGAGGFLFSEM